MSYTTRFLAVAALAAGALASSAASADDGPWMMRVRAVNLSPANKSDAIPALSVPSDAIHINSKWLPDVDFEYFFAPNWSAELILTYPQSQDVTLAGTKIGTFKHLPPILTAKYNFLPNSDFRPYLGVGVNFTIISNVDINVPGVGALDLSKTSVGPAVQAGFDWKVADHVFVNIDFKYAKLQADVKAGGAKVSTVHVDPLLSGIGVGYRF